MIDSIILSIVEAEAKADNLVKEASAKAKAIIQKAELDCDAIKKNIVKAVKINVKEVLQSAEECALIEYNKIIAEGVKKAESIKANAQKQLLKADEYIIKGLVEKYGNS